MGSVINDAMLAKRVRSLLPFVAASPSLLALLASVIFLFVWADWRLRHPDNDLNPAEAALTRDVGRLYRLLEAGSSPTASYPIRRTLRSKETSSMLTPLQAAIVGDSRSAVILLLGDNISPEQITLVGCMALKARARNIEEWLTEQGASERTDANCP